jgi:hypothetical protein
VSEAAQFIDAALQREASWERADALNALDDGLRYYGASVGAVRGTVRDAGRKFRGLDRKAVLYLSAELWFEPVFERRLAAVVLLQTHGALLRHTDLARLERFVRDGHRDTLVDPVVVDVVGPLAARLTGAERAHAEEVLDRWAASADPWLRRAALLAPLRELRSGAGDEDAFLRRARVALAQHDDDSPVRGGLAVLRSELGKRRPELLYAKELTGR